MDSPTCDNKTRLHLLNSCVVSGMLSSALQTLSFLLLIATLLGIFHWSSIFMFTDENVCNSPKVTRLPSGRVKIKPVGSPGPGSEPLSYGNHTARPPVKLSFKLSNAKNSSDLFDEGSFLTRPCYF